MVIKAKHIKDIKSNNRIIFNFLIMLSLCEVFRDVNNVFEYFTRGELEMKTRGYQCFPLYYNLYVIYGFMFPHIKRYMIVN